MCSTRGSARTSTRGPLHPWCWPSLRHRDPCLVIDLIFVPPGFCFRISVLISRESQSLPEVKSQGLWFWSIWQISLSRSRYMDIREQMCPNKAFMSNTLPSKTTTSHKKENVQWIENLPQRTLSTKKGVDRKNVLEVWPLRPLHHPHHRHPCNRHHQHQHQRSGFAGSTMKKIHTERNQTKCHKYSWPKSCLHKQFSKWINLPFNLLSEPILFIWYILFYKKKSIFIIPCHKMWVWVDGEQ